MNINRADLESIVRAIAETVVREMTAPTPGAAEASRRGCGGCDSCSCQQERATAGPLKKAAAVAATVFEGRLLTEEALLASLRGGSRELQIRPGTLVTPLARDRARGRGIALTVAAAAAIEPVAARDSVGACETAGESSRRLSLLAVHTHRSVEQAVVAAAGQVGYQVQVAPVRSHTSAAVEEAALACARAVSGRECRRAIVIDENVYALSLQMGRIAGVRPSICWDAESALASRRECGSNVLLLSSRLVGLSATRRIVTAWLGEES